MDLNLPEDIMDLKSMVRRFTDKTIEQYIQTIEETHKIPEELTKQASELGFMGLSIPEEYGGLGLGQLGKAIVYQETARGSLAFSTFMGVHTGIGTMPLLFAGNEEQKQRYLPSIANGSKICCFALTEPNAGSDAANLRTTAVKKGDKWILNGTKQFITNGLSAEIMTVAAKTDKDKGAKGISLFLVEKGFPGVKVGAIENKMGLNGSETVELIFEDCEVPEENLLGPLGEGYFIVVKVLTNGRAGLAARMVGAAEKMLELSIEYAKQRVQFGKPICENQGIQWMLAEMATEIELARAMAYKVAWMADHKMSVAKEAPMVKLFATEMAGRVADKALQIHGGMGYMKECAIERFYRDVRICRIYEGTSEIQKNIIGRQLLK